MINEFIISLLALVTELLSVNNIWSKEVNSKFSSAHFVPKIISIVKNKIIININLKVLFHFFPLLQY